MKFARTARRLAPAAIGFLMVPSVIALPATADTTSSGTPAPAPSAWVRVQPAPQLPAGTTALGAVTAATTMTGAVALAPRDEAALEAFISNVTNKSSAEYGQYLAPGAFASQFGPLASTISAVEQAVQADGLEVTGVSSDGLLVDFSGTAAQVQTTFGTHLESYHMRAGWTGRGTTEPVQLQLPANLSTAVTGVLGLDDLVQAQSAVASGGTAPAPTYPPAEPGTVPSAPGAPTPCADAQQAAVSSGGLTDDQIANAYGAFGLYQQGDFAQGQHIAVYELEPFLATDIEGFDTCYFGATEAAQMSGTDGNLAGSRLSVIPVDGGQLPGSGSDEAVLDIEDVSAMAPEADVDVYEAPNTSFGGIDDYATIIDSDTDQVVTSSWGLCEQLAQEAEPGIQEEENFLFQQAAAQGQTVLSAAGDTGSDNCNSYRSVPPPPGQNLLSLDDPASQPYVVSVGGTTIDDASKPLSEHVWNDGADWGAGGGGISETWTMPAWQQKVALTAANATDVANAEEVESANAASEAPFATPSFCDGTLGLPPGTPCREAPDVSAQADEFTGAVTIFGSDLGYGPPDGWSTIGGTSSATPIWAAMLALVNASRFCSADLVTFANGKVQDAGFASPILYGVAANATAYAASFNNITVGNNDVYGLDNGLVFPAHAGYSMASGLGSPQLTGPNGGNGLAFYMCEYGATLSPPTVTGLSPTYGPLGPGDVVTVSGSGFETASGTPDVASVQVGSGVATSFVVQSKTSLQVTLPAADTTLPPGSPDPTQDGAGPADIVVSLTNGQSSASGARSLFDFVDETSPGPAQVVPSVTGLSPYGGLDPSPATVTVFGSGFVSPGSADEVEFGGVAATSVTYVSPFELTVTPPPFSALAPGTACPVDNGAPGQPLNPDDDICQVEVTVTTTGGTSGTAAPLAPYEGPLNYDNMGGEILPSGCNCEDEPQADEYDYVPLPSITSTSTSTSEPASLASEYGGATSNTVVVNGTGLDPMTLDYALLTSGSPFNENSIFYPLQDSGTFMVLEAPGLLPPGVAPTTEPVGVTVGAESVAGTSTDNGTIYYSGVPVTTSVVNTSETNSLDGLYGAVDTGGAPLTLDGTGFSQAISPVIFYESTTGTDLATQYNYQVVSDSEVTTESVAMDPDLVDVYLCSTTGCTTNPPADELLVYPPGNPIVTSVTPSSGPPSGGTQVVISGQNLGCAVSVSFGSVVAESFANEPALLDCGTTGLVDATSPPGTPATKVPVTVETAESFFTGAAASGPATFSYTGAPGSPVITSPASATAQVGKALSFGITTAGNPPVSLSEAGPLPDGIRFRTEGAGSAELEGTPAYGSGGIYYFTLTAANRAGTATQAFTLTVNQGPGITSVRSVETVVVGEPSTIQVATTGYPTPGVFISAGVLPAGLSASDGTDGILVISGTAQPGSAGHYELQISASNTVGTASEVVAILVSEGP